MMSEIPAGFRCVVAATDFSVESERALAWAARLAALRGAELRLVHAVALGEGNEPLLPVDGRVEADLLDAARERLAELAAPLRHQVRAVTYEAVIGPAPHAILQEAAAHQAEMLVVGTRGLRGWRHVVLGSTAQRVIAGAACPVLAVHGEDPLPPERSWRALGASDGSADAAQAIRAAARLIVPLTELVLLRAFEPPPVFYVGAGALGTNQIILEARQTAEQGLQEEARALAAEGIDARPQLRDGFPPEVIVTAASELHADLIVLGSRGHGGIAHLLLGSTAERVAQRATVPVLVVPRRATPALRHADEAMAIVGAPTDEQC
jgi:nucleotide-binding universal stress UspA family protein